jgi:hypothetical protein
MEKLVSAFSVVMLGLGAIIVVSLIMALPVMWLWNDSLVPAVNGVHQISWMQALGISILCSILFKNSSSD